MKFLDIHVARLRKLEEILSPIKGADIELRRRQYISYEPDHHGSSIPTCRSRNPL
jgi:hypothetical protein